MIPPPPPPRAQSNVNQVPPPPPPPPPEQEEPRQKASTPQTPPPRQTSSVYPQLRSYEPYGEIQTPTTGISQRHTTEWQSQTSSSNYVYGGGASSSYTVPSSSYGIPKTSESQKRLSATSESSPALQYRHNFASAFFLLPTLISILWWHESPVIIQIFLFVILLLYGLDLINARDGLAVAVWIAALVLTMASGFGTLLQVDDADADGSTMILFLVRLAVEGMLFCSVVSSMYSIQKLISTRSVVPSLTFKYTFA